jgi:hypothetical protein
MLHAPANATKTENTHSAIQRAPMPERELHPHTQRAIGSYPLSSMGSVTAVRSPEAQRRQALSGMQSTHGNQAVLRMLHGPQQVARMPALRPSQSIMLQRKCACGGSSESIGECAECKAKHEAALQRRVANQGVSPAANNVPPIVHDVLSSSGQSLDAGTRAFMEPRFGHDFSQVRVHTDARAAESARAVNALAYTVGRDVVFGHGQYKPETNEGRRLMAHELTHVVQQKQNSLLTKQLEVSQDNALEKDADYCANAILQDKQPSLESPRVTQSALMRQEISDEEQPTDQPDEADFETESTDQLDEADFEDQLVSLAPEQLLALNEGRRPTGKRRRPTGKRRRKPAPKPKEPKERIPTATSPSEGALKALDAAQKLHDQQDPAIWYDGWGNDLRDNNLTGKIDEAAEQGISDGAHYGKLFDAKVCKDPSDTTDSCPPGDQSMIKVQYKVCIDIPIEAYKAAGANVSTSRWIPTFFSELSKKPNWTVWKKPLAPSQLLDGDIVAASNPDHQHAGIVSTGTVDQVINLPGPTAARKFHVFNPSGKNDIVTVPRFLFEVFLAIDWIARLNK